MKLYRMASNNKILSILGWVFFIPVQLIVSGIITFFLHWMISGIPLIKIILKIGGESSPFSSGNVNGPFGFIYVFAIYTTALSLSTLISMFITSNFKLAWRIIWMFQLFPFLIFPLLQQVNKSIDLFNSHNIWFNLAEILSLATAAIITWYYTKEER
jgi:hypothetical protein